MSRSRRIRYSSPRISTSKPASGANSTRSPSSRLRTVGPTATTSAHMSRRLRVAVAGVRIPPRLFRAPVSSLGSTSRRSAVMRIDCLESSVRSVARGAMNRGYRRAAGAPWPATPLREPREAAARFAGVAESSEVAGRRAPFVTQAPPESSRTDGWTRRAGATALAYFHLTKPRVIELLLVTTLPAMILAAGEMPPLALIVEVLVGGALAAGGANTINCWIECDRDQMMRRTAHRPLPHGDVNSEGALVFGLVLEALAFALLWSTVNLLSAVLAVSAMLFYVFVYTIWLKPRSPQNIVIGGAAGAVPVLVGWAAVTGSLAAPAWVLFAIVFFWTPPHFWALSLRYRDDYQAAGIPMLPVARGIASAARQILVYSLIVVAVTLLLFRFESMGVVYLVAAVGLGGAFIWQAFGLQRDATSKRAMRLFTFSNTYLALLFAAIAVDTLVRAF